MAPKIVIVGGVAGGANAAARARRLSESAVITVFERGEYVSFANCGLPYHIGGEIEERQKLLVHTPESLIARFNIAVHVRHEVVSIDRERRQIAVRNLDTARQFQVDYDELILATGAAPLMPNLPGLNQKGIFTLRDIRDMDSILEWISLSKPQRATVVGGGFIGLEMVEQLRHRGLEITLIESNPQVLNVLDPDVAAFLLKELEQHNVQVILDDAVERFESPLITVTKSGRSFEGDMIVFGIGVRPESELASLADLELGSRGSVKVNEYLQTSDPNIWAVGDCIEVVHGVSGTPAVIPLAGPANRQGRLVADNILGEKKPYRGTIGTAIARVFRLAAGVTGANSRLLESAGIPFQSVTVHPSSHASYYPGAKPLTIKVLFHPESGKLLGAAAVGEDGVDKRVDVLATAILAGMTVQDLGELELSYAPPFGSAKDPVNIAGMVASNVLEGKVQVVSAAEALRGESSNELFLDVRSSEEVAKGAVPGSIHIPLPEIRSRLSDLDREREYLVYCHSGQRSYNACRILMQNGFRCRNISGAWRSLSALLE